MLPAAEPVQSAACDAVDRAVDRAQLPVDRLRPLAELAPARLAALRGLLTDIDDTLTRDGAIEPAALAALHRLADAGVPVVAITGRPAGWSEPSRWPGRWLPSSLRTAR